MRKNRGFMEMKKAIASFTVMAMLFTGSTVSLYADDIRPDAAVKTAEAAVNESEPVILKEDETPGNLEVNQGFSLHVKKDLYEGDSPTYMSNFVASKQTIVAYPVDADSDEKAKEAIKNWKLYYKKADSEGNDEGDAILTWEGSNENDFTITDYYEENSNTVSGKKMVYAKMNVGPEAGKYNFRLFDGEKEIANDTNVDFYATNPLNILAVPVTAYYGQAQNPKGGGAPSVGSFECGSNWDGTIAKVKEYLFDVYPLSEINIDEGNVFDASGSEYDMCTDDGQKKLWEEVSKLQVRDKETGKDKYDIILAFVMYRQDASGNGQGYTYGRPTNIITLMDEDMLPTVAHEIAHCYGIGDEYDGGSYNFRTNNVPLEYKSKGRDKVDSSSVEDTTAYTKKNVEKYSDVDQNKYPWVSSDQYKGRLSADAKVYDDKTKDAVNENGKGTVVDLKLHPFILSKSEFVHYAKKDNEVFPTISYMGSGYSGNEYYYFTTSVIWDHLFNEFMKKEKKEEATAESASLLDSEEDEDLELYYDDEMRFGESKLVEVSGEIQYSGKTEDATVSGCIVDPMFSYKGDLEYIDYLDKNGDDKGMNDKDLFIFAALDKDGKVITSPVDGNKSTVEFFASNINTAINVDAISENDVDKRIQDFCEFEFEAEYPDGTAAFAILNDLDENKSYKEGDEGVLWFKEVPAQEIDGTITDVTNTKDEMKVQWVCGAFDKNDEATQDNLYTMVYYAPKGDEGEVYFMEDGFINAEENEPGMYDFNVSENGIATYSFKPAKYFKEDEITDKAYVWVKVSDGVNGLDLYSDEYDPEKAEEKKKAIEEEKKKAEERAKKKAEEQKKAEEEAKKKAETEKAVSENKITGKVEGAALNISDLQGATVNYNTQIPSFGKSFKAKDWKNILGDISVSYNNAEYTPKKVKVTKAKGKDSLSFNASIQITDIEGGADLKTVKKALKKATKADKSFDNNKIKIQINPLNIEYAVSNNQIDKPVIKGKADKLAVTFKYQNTGKKFTVKNGKKDSFGAPASIAYDAATKAVTIKSGDVVGVLKDGQYESKIK